MAKPYLKEIEFVFVAGPEMERKLPFQLLLFLKQKTYKSIIFSLMGQTSNFYRNINGILFLLSIIRIDFLSSIRNQFLKRQAILFLSVHNTLGSQDPGS